MTDSADDAVMLVLPRTAWDALASTKAPAVRTALDSLVQVDRLLHVSVMVVGGRVERLQASVHLDAAEAVAEEWLAADGSSTDTEVVVRSVPVGLQRHGRSCG
jgi:hypothetical protein